MDGITGDGKLQIIETPPKLPPFDDRSGNHMWTILCAYEVNPDEWLDPDSIPQLTADKLRDVSSIGCVYCGLPYDSRLKMRRCRGKIK